MQVTNASTPARVRDIIFNTLPIFYYWPDGYFYPSTKYFPDASKQLPFNFYPDVLQWPEARCVAATNPTQTSKRNYGASGVSCSSLDIGALFETLCSLPQGSDYVGLNNDKPTSLRCVAWQSYQVPSLPRGEGSLTGKVCTDTALITEIG